MATIAQLKQKIQEYTSNDPQNCVSTGHIDDREAADLIATTNSVRRRDRASALRMMRDLYDRQPEETGLPSFTEACPENPGVITFDPEAAHTTLDLLLDNRVLPAAAVREQVRELAANGLYGEDVESLPEEVRRGSQQFFVRDDSPRDGFTIYAYVTQGTAADRDVYFEKHAPRTRDISYSKQKLDAGLDPFRRHQIVEAVEKADAAGEIEWSNRPSFPMGSKMYNANLWDVRHPDGYSYQVYIPVGSLTTPVGPNGDPFRIDPDDVDKVYVVRRGGLGHLTQYATQPLTIKPGEQPDAPKPSLVKGDVHHYSPSAASAHWVEGGGAPRPEWMPPLELGLHVEMTFPKGGNPVATADFHNGEMVVMVDVLNAGKLTGNETETRDLWPNVEMLSGPPRFGDFPMVVKDSITGKELSRGRFNNIPRP